MADGSHKSDKLLKMSAEQAKDPEYIMKAHGYDPNKWEVTNAKNNIWNVYSKQDGIQTLYSSKLTVKPLKDGFDVELFLEKVNRKIVPVRKKSKISGGGRLLEIPLYDLHMGINTYDDYKDRLAEIVDSIESKEWDTIFVPVGQDLLHNNGFSGKTSSGTDIEKVDMTKAWDDAFKLYCELLDVAQNNAKSVYAPYSLANHDDSMSWAFVKALE